MEPAVEEILRAARVSKRYLLSSLSLSLSVHSLPDGRDSVSTPITKSMPHAFLSEPRA